MNTASGLPISAHRFRKSSYSQSEAACVEVAEWEAGAAVRDTQHREPGALAFALGEWRAFLDTAKNDTR
ncbi:DUF397 domain-containing protein [Nocardiopsis sp. N85]|uniref:DUF397 domain-containing protein n=1 Tax=Nocardiopsis sp. N85 TaxID=3029400 RepID=UPI00237F1813|nr:DUF397 domain-containing protein [Nocardiopsis sp. N85]MDE3725080.1 DUF397 domain-containing protein [Nocardiopsis sp. N85]